MKIEAGKDWPRKLTPTNIRSILGLGGYYRRFVDGFASIASSLTTLTQKSMKFEWSGKCEKIFQKMKESLTSAAVLSLPEGTKVFIVFCDAS